MGSKCCIEGRARCCESQSGSRALVGVCMCVEGVSVCVCRWSVSVYRCCVQEEHVWVDGSKGCGGSVAGRGSRRCRAPGGLPEEREE